MIKNRYRFDFFMVITLQNLILSMWALKMINEYVHIPKLLFFNVGVITPGSRMDFLIFIIYIFILQKYPISKKIIGQR
jgi:hypothetical protein